MSFLSRLRNIIKSNINFNNDIDIEKYDYLFEQKVMDDEDDVQPETKATNLESEYYAILELPIGSDFEQIKKAYKKLLKKYHPDLYHNKPKKLEIAQKLTEKLNEAYHYFEQKFK